MFESKRPIAQVAQDMGIRKEALRQLVRQAEADRGRRRDLLTSEERARLLRAEVRPDPATVTRFVEERRDAFGVERSAACAASR